MKIISVLLVFCFIHIKSSISQTSFPFEPRIESLGVILDSTFNIIGTGSVFSVGNGILTCDHVETGTAGKKYFQQLGTNRLFSLKIFKRFPQADLAFFISDSVVTYKYLKPDTSYRFNLRDSIYYVNYSLDSLNKKHVTFVKRTAVVESVGLYEAGTVKTAFVEFVGDYTIPGNSGTPVFNRSGEVIGIIAQAWKKVSLKRSKTQQLVNRAFTIMPLSELIEPVKLAVKQKALQKKMSKKQE